MLRQSSQSEKSARWESAFRKLAASISEKFHSQEILLAQAAATGRPPDHAHLQTVGKFYAYKGLIEEIEDIQKN